MIQVALSTQRHRVEEIIVGLCGLRTLSCCSRRTLLSSFRVVWCIPSFKF